MDLALQLNLAINLLDLPGRSHISLPTLYTAQPQGSAGQEAQTRAKGFTLEVYNTIWYQRCYMLGLLWNTPAGSLEG